MKNIPDNCSFGGSGIDEEVYSWIVENLPSGKTILEIGAGNVSTRYLASKYIVYSVEHLAKFCGKWHNRYIHAKLVDGWYDVEYLKASLPKSYNLILVDGPIGSESRMGFFHNRSLFDLTATIVVHDTNRCAEKNLIDLLEKETNKKKIMFETFGVLK